MIRRRSRWKLNQSGTRWIGRFNPSGKASVNATYGRREFEQFGLWLDSLFAQRVVEAPQRAVSLQGLNGLAGGLRECRCLPGPDRDGHALV